MQTDRSLIEQVLGLNSGAMQGAAITSNLTFGIGSWFYRLANAQNPVKTETAISVYADSERSPVLGAYLQFHRDPAQAQPPSHNPTNRMLYVHYGWDQKPQIREVLALVGSTPVALVYLEFENGHIWAELQHKALP